MMSKETIKFEDFLTEVNSLSPDTVSHVNRINDLLIKNNCDIKIETSKSGFVVSYSYKKEKVKSVILNFVFRKKGLIARIYGDYVQNYQDYLDNLPETMIKEIEKASVCRRLIDPEKCNSRCKMGYDFNLKDNHYQKCRFGSFMFLINDTSIDGIIGFLENEIKYRAC